MTKRLFAIMLVAILTISLAACGGNSPAPVADNSSGNDSGAAEAPAAPVAEPVNDKVLVVAVEATFSEKWNPYLAENAYDRQVTDQIFIPILQKNANNEMVPYAGSVVPDEQADGSVIYTVKLNEGMVFSDGTPVTIDDYIENLYVRSDPSYTAIGGTLAVPIEGVAEYYYDDPNYSTAITAMEADAEANWSTANITFDNFLVYAKDTGLDGWFNPDGLDEFTEYINGEGEQYAAMLTEADATNPDDVLRITAQIEYDAYRDAYDTYNWYLDAQKKEYALNNVKEGVSVSEISGIKKIDDLTCTVKFTEIDIYGDRTLGDAQMFGLLIPRHYYGEHVKGDVSSILANMVPMGSGPYVWDSYADNIVTLTSSNNFFLGTAKIGTVRWQFVPQTDTISALASGTVDIAVVTGSRQNVEELDGIGNISYDLTDNAGFGYVGLNCENLPLGVRKGLLSLMNRQPAVEGWYGPIASVIERPMTTVLAEYPDSATQFYPYSRDEALKHFETAGYTQKDGKLVNADGKQLTANVYIGGEGQGLHPSYSMLVQAAEDLKALGGELQIQDVPFGVLMAAMDDGTADMFCLAWSEVNTCDKKEQYYTGSGQNKFKVSDAKLDDLLDKISVCVDQDERKKLVADMLDVAMDLAFEYPVYQRKNIIAYNSDTVNMDTIPEATAFYDYEDELWQVDIN